MFESEKEIPLRNLNAWFTEMAAIASKPEESSSLPKLELLLRNGSIIRGYILKLKQDGHDQLLMIAGFKDQYNKNEITFLPSHEVVALTLLEPAGYLKQYILPATSKAIGSLELKRAVRSVNERMDEFFSEKVSIQAHADTYPESARWDVLQVIQMLPQLLEDLTADELGKKLVNGKINGIELVVSDVANTSLEQGILNIRINSPVQTPLAQEKERIKNEIERLL